MAHQQPPSVTSACFVHPPDPVHPNTPNPFKQQMTQGELHRKSRADISGVVAEGIVVVLGGLGKNGASIETMSQHPALRNPELDWLQEFAYIYKTGWLDSECSQVPSTEVRVLPKQEPQPEERPTQDIPVMSPFPDTFDGDSDSSSIQLEHRPLRFGSRRTRKLSAWKARQLDSACQHCRSQHSMCDRIQPSCTTCQDANLHCSYDAAPARGQHGWPSPSSNNNKLGLDATVSKIKSWLLPRSHQESPLLGSCEEAGRRPSLSLHFGGWLASAKRRCSPKPLSAVVGRSRGASDADQRRVGRGILGLPKGGANIPTSSSGVGKEGGSSGRSQAATIVAHSNPPSAPPVIAQSHSSSGRRSSVTRSDSFRQSTTVALHKAADEAMNAPPDCPSRPFQCTFCLQQCLTKPAWQCHEESHRHDTGSPRRQHSRASSSSTSSGNATSKGPWNWNCGFCHKTLTTWAERVNHIGGHYDCRLTMASWDPLTSPHPFDKASLTYVGESPRWSTVKLLVAQRPELFNHITRTGETEKIFRCRFCDTRYRTWEEFECHHELWHRRHYTWSCPTLEELKDRLLLAEDQEQQPAPPPPPPPTDDPGTTTPALCPCCASPTPAPYLLTHLATAHNFAACTRHGVRFTTERHFRMHLANRHGFHEGAACGEGFIGACRRAEAPLEVERREVVGRR